jgi:hypothetical protein
MLGSAYIPFWDVGEIGLGMSLGGFCVTHHMAAYWEGGVGVNFAVGFDVAPNKPTVVSGPSEEGDREGDRERTQGTIISLWWHSRD